MAHAQQRISVECQDDQFGLHAEVVYDERSFPLRRCTPFVTESYHGATQNHNAAGQVQQLFAVQIGATVGFSTNQNVMGADNLTFTDGTSPRFMTLAMGSQHRNSQELMNREERYDKEKPEHPKRKEKKL